MICALRAPTTFSGRIKDIRPENAVIVNTKRSAGGVIQDRRWRMDGFFIRAPSAIRADGFSSAQHRTLQQLWDDLSRHV